MRIFNFLVFAGIVLFFLEGCTKNCASQEGNNIRPAFYDSSGNVYSYDSVFVPEHDIAVKTSASWVSWDEHTRILPLDIASDHTTFVFKSGGQSDTLKLTYHSEPYYTGHVCGVETKITGLKVQSTFASYEIKSSDEGLNTWDINFYK